MGRRTPQSKLGRARKEVRAKGLAKVTSPQALRILERRYGVWKLRKDGFSVRAIAESLGANEATVREDIVVIAQRISKETAESVEESRFLQVERLDALLVKYQPLAEGGNLSAASMVLNIEARRSKLLALDLPEQKKLDVTGIREYIGINLDDV